MLIKETNILDIIPTNTKELITLPNGFDYSFNKQIILSNN